MRELTLTPQDFPPRRRVASGEGGAIYNAEREGKFYVITDERARAGLLDDEDLRDLVLGKVMEFDTAAQRDAYLLQRGWVASTWSHRGAMSPNSGAANG